MEHPKAAKRDELRASCRRALDAYRAELLIQLREAHADARMETGPLRIQRACGPIENLAMTLGQVESAEKALWFR